MQRIFIVSLFSIFLVACGGTPKSVNRQPEPVSRNTPVPDDVAAKDIPTLLAEAQEQTGEARNITLIRLLTKLAEEDCHRTTFAAKHLLELTTLPDSHAVAFYQATLQCYIALENTESAIQMLSSMPNEILSEPEILPIRYQLALSQEQWLSAAAVFYQMSDNTRENALHIWQLLENLNNEQIQQANDGFSPLSPWFDLIILQRSLPIPAPQLTQKLTEWKSRYPRHLFAERWPERFQDIINITPISRSYIAVLLPLSGRWQEQGEAIKSGILAAKFSFADMESSIVFFDSNQMETIAIEELQRASIIIGPLLKEHIDHFVTIAPENVPVLYLNRVDSPQQLNNNEQYFYSLAPEDEAQQLATRLVKYKTVSPVVIAAQNGAYQRMKQAFLDTWQAETGSTPLAMDFENNDSLRDGIDQLLDIKDSKRRIRQIENMLTPELHSEERNRRDIDAIVVFANASQTELINPIIESSISPFADLVPVFASSRSYSTQLNQNSLRDLRNLTFVEMPWMLPSVNLRYFQNLASSLWPERSDTENRLFAMGYDAFNIIPSLRFLRSVPKTSFLGLTGKLVLNELNETTRQLAWAAVQDEEIQLIEMD